MREIIIEEAAYSSAEELAAYLRRRLHVSHAAGEDLSALANVLANVTSKTRVVAKLDASAANDAPWLTAFLEALEAAAEHNPLLDVVSYVDDLAEDGEEEPSRLDAATALARLKSGNEAYVTTHQNIGDTSPDLIVRLFHEGQTPYATVICCSDSRVVPEHIFMCGLGEIFVIRVAGNVVGPMELASAVYACEHLHTPLLLVLGHTHCGAIEAAAEGHAEGALKQLVHKIADAVGAEKDPYAATVLNVRAGLKKLHECAELEHLVANGELLIEGGVYHTHSGVVDFLCAGECHCAEALH